MFLVIKRSQIIVSPYIGIRIQKGSYVLLLIIYVELTQKQARLLSDRNEKRPRILPVQCKRTVNLKNKMKRFTPKPVNRYGTAG